MSKKSRKRNRKILKALAVGLGAAALMKGRNKGAVSTVGQPVGVGRMDPNAVTGTEYPGANKVIADPIKQPIKKYKFSKRSNRGVKDYNTTTPFHPSQGNTSPQWFGEFNRSNLGSGWMAKGGRAGHKSGGRVGVGKAKRGFGRALKKGK